MVNLPWRQRSIVRMTTMLVMIEHHRGDAGGHWDSRKVGQVLLSFSQVHWGLWCASIHAQPFIGVISFNFLKSSKINLSSSYFRMEVTRPHSHKTCKQATWCQEPNPWKRHWCWERSKAGGEAGNRGWDGHEFVQTPGDGEGQGSLVCCSPWDHKESDRT